MMIILTYRFLCLVPSRSFTAVGDRGPGKKGGTAMSDNLKQFLVSLASDSEKLGGYLSDPDAAMAAAGLAAEDRAALKSGSQASIQARLSGPEAVNVVAPPQYGPSIVHAPPHFVTNLEGPPKYLYPYSASSQPYSPPSQPTIVHVHVMPPVQYGPPPTYGGPSIVHAPPPLHGAEGATVFSPPKYQYLYSPPPPPYSPPPQLAIVHVHVHPAIYTSPPLIAPPLVAPPLVAPPSVAPPPVAPPLAAAPAGGAAAEASAAQTSGPTDPAGGSIAGKHEGLETA
jgi:hypothetical protein